MKKEKVFLNNCEKKLNPYSKRAKPLKLLPPIYPELGRIYELEANLLIEFTINKNGEVEDPYVVWQDQTGEYRGKDVFSKNALISVKKYKYEPKKKFRWRNSYFNRKGISYIQNSGSRG